MNEQAQKILVDLLQKASNGIDSAVSFSQAQIPDVVHQLLVWNFVSSLGTQLLGALFITCSLFLPSFAKKSKRNGASWTAFDGSPNSSYFISSMRYDFCVLLSPWLLSVSGLIMILLNFTWLKIWLAPKLYLIEYAASLVK